MSTISESLSTGTSQSATTTASSLLKNVTRFEDLQAKNSSKGSQEMGKQDFLTLFTAQLKNQNPLDPVKNEAFVAQLAQFSQLEALTNMQTSLDSFVTSMSSERLLGSAALIGKKVSMADAPAALGESGGIEASLQLVDGASGLKVDVQDSSGRTVQQLIFGAQDPGTSKIAWDGFDANGMRASAGNYRLVATAVVNGKTTTVPVQTMATVQSIVSNSADGAISLQVDGGKSVLLKDAQRLGM